MSFKCRDAQKGRIMKFRHIAAIRQQYEAETGINMYIASHGDVMLYKRKIHIWSEGINISVLLIWAKL